MVDMRYIPRKFLGNIEGFNSREDRILNQKMLKAYLKGQEYFRCGFKDGEKGTRIPNYFKVLERKARWEEVKCDLKS